MFKSSRFGALIFVAALAIGSVVSYAQDKTTAPSISYSLSMSDPASHLFEVSIRVKSVGAFGGNIQFQMPKWAPGRYAVFDFAKNVQQATAYSGECPENAMCKLPAVVVDRVNDQTWRVNTANLSNLTFSYKVYGNDLSGTFSQLNQKHATFNGGSVFMYIVDHKPDAVSLSINAPKDWRIVNGRMESPDQRLWSFPNYDEMIDTPTEVGPDFTVDSFSLDGRKYNVAVHSLGAEGGKRSELVAGIEKIVKAETAMWGPPEFKSYTFLIHYAADGRSGDGMEHLTSTQIIQPGSLGDAGSLEDTLETVAHEFFHVWNVKRLRPIGLGPWDFTHDVATRGLWVAEGFTNYYGHVMLGRAGIWTEKQLLDQLGQVVTGVENAPGTRLMSAVESSLSAPFIDGAPSAQRNNLENTSISYYYKGESIALVLDSFIRKQTAGKKSLDDVMRLMYNEFYVKAPNDSYYLHGRAYDVDDVEKSVSKIAGTDMHDFFVKYVWGTEPLPYKEALEGIGVKANISTSKTPYFGASVRRGSIRSVSPDSPAEAAGVRSGDVLVSIADKPMAGLNVAKLVGSMKPGEALPVTVRRNGDTIQIRVILGSMDMTSYTLVPASDSPSAGRALRNDWFAGIR